MVSEYSSENLPETITPLSTREIHIAEIEGIVLKIDRVREKMVELDKALNEPTADQSSFAGVFVHAVQRVSRMEIYLTEMDKLNKEVQAHGKRIEEIHALYRT